MKKQALVIGSLNVDLVMTVDSLPREGETIQGHSLTYIPGGKGANQACAAGKLGGAVKMLGCIGEDEFGAMQKSGLALAGVDVSALKISTGQKTGIASIYVDSHGKNNIVIIAGANGECDVTYLRENDQAFRECSCVILQMEIPWESICYAVDRAAELGKTVIFNPAPAERQLPEDFLKKIDYITPNETELMRLCNKAGENMEDYIAGARELLAKGVKNVLVTLGDKGVLLVNDREEKIYPARTVRAVDTTAAGDCFNGAFMAAKLEGRSDAEAIVFANTASSIAVTRKGAQTSIPTREEVEEALKGC